jgi:hypothetical protein
MSSNENKMSDGGHRRKTIRRECVIIALGKPGAWSGIQERASLAVEVSKSSQKWRALQSAVRSIAWLGLCDFDVLSAR